MSFIRLFFLDVPYVVDNDDLVLIYKSVTAFRGLKTAETPPSNLMGPKRPPSPRSMKTEVDVAVTFDY